MYLCMRHLFERLQFGAASAVPELVTAIARRLVQLSGLRAGWVEAALFGGSSDHPA